LKYRPLLVDLDHSKPQKIKDFESRTCHRLPETMKEYLVIFGLYFLTNLGTFLREGGSSSPVATALMNMSLAVLFMLILVGRVVYYLSIQVEEMKKKWKDNGKGKQTVITDFIK